MPRDILIVNHLLCFKLDFVFPSIRRRSMRCLQYIVTFILVAYFAVFVEATSTPASVLYFIWFHLASCILLHTRHDILRFRFIYVMLCYVMFG